MNYVTVAKMASWWIANDFQKVLMFKSEVYKYLSFPKSICNERDAIKNFNMIIWKGQPLCVNSIIGKM